MNKHGVRPAPGQCYHCDGPMVMTIRYPNALLCARCLCQPGLCRCSKIVE